MVIDVSKNVNQSSLNGNVTFNNSRLSIKPNSAINIGDSQTQTTLENASSLSFYNNSVANFNGTTAFNGVSYLNLNPNAQLSFNQANFNNANVTFYGILYLVKRLILATLCALSISKGIRILIKPRSI